MMNKLSGIWRRIQGSLFPRLDDALSSPMTDDHKKVAKILEIVRAEDVIRQPHQWTGRPAHEWALIGRAFVAKAVLGLRSTRDLISRLKVDENLRRLCGWQNGQVPSESTFSRVFAPFWEANDKLSPFGSIMCHFSGLFQGKNRFLMIFRKHILSLFQLSVRIACHLPEALSSI